MESDEKRSTSKDPNLEDDIWQEVNRHLWEMVQETGVRGNIHSDLPKTAGGVSLKNLRKKDCLTFERCEEVAAAPGSLNASDKVHLENCLYCERRISAFSNLSATEEMEPERRVVPTPEQEKGFAARFREKIAAAFARPLVAGFTLAALALLIGILGSFVLRDPSGPDHLAEKQPAAVNTLTKEREEKETAQRNSTNSTTAVVTEDDSLPADGKVNPDRTESAQSPRPDTARQPRERQIETSTSLLNLTGIPEAIHGFVITVRNSARIPVSQDLESLLKKLPSIRGAAEPKLLSPNRIAIVEDQPTFRWEGRPNAVFEIVVRNNEKKIVSQRKNLTEDIWVIPEKLPPGIYFWEITDYVKGKEVAKSQREAIFNIVDKAIVDRVKSENHSHLDKAIFFINVGLLNDAEIELKAEIRKNPRSQKAKNILMQVRQWQRQLR